MVSYMIYLGFSAKKILQNIAFTVYTQLNGHPQNQSTQFNGHPQDQSIQFIGHPQYSPHRI